MLKGISRKSERLHCTVSGLCTSKMMVYACVVPVLTTHSGVLVSETIGGIFLVVKIICEGGAGGEEECYGLQSPCLRIDSSFFPLLCGMTKLTD